MDKEDMVHVHNGYYETIRQNKIMSFAATWNALEIIILSEVSQKENDKYHMISFVCGI